MRSCNQSVSGLTGLWDLPRYQVHGRFSTAEGWNHSEDVGGQHGVSLYDDWWWWHLVPTHVDDLLEWIGFTGDTSHRTFRPSSACRFPSTPKGTCKTTNSPRCRRGSSRVWVLTRCECVDRMFGGRTIPTRAFL